MAWRRPRDLAEHLASRRALADGYVRQHFTLPRPEAREAAKEFLRCYPTAAYFSAVERWRELPDGQIEFTMKRRPTAD